MVRIGRTLPAISDASYRVGATGFAAAPTATGELERITSMTRSFSSGEMLASAEFLITIPALAQ